MSQKLITVFGATGNQGGSVVSAVLSNPTLSSKYKLRAITRDTSKPNAQALASKGVELAQADLNDKASVKKAITGSYGVFAVTNYWETTQKSVEFSQGQNLVDASKEEGIKHLVWSSLPNVTKLTDGKLKKVEHFDSKAEVAEYAESVKGDMLVSYFMPGFFMSNLTSQIKPGEDDTLALSQPWHPTQTQLPMIDVRHDTGKFVVGLFEAGKEANGAEVQGVSQWIHPEQITDTVGKITGREIKFVEQKLDVETTEKMDRIPAELMQNMLLIRDYSYFGQGTEKKQDKSDRFLLEGEKKVSWADFAKDVKWSF